MFKTKLSVCLVLSGLLVGCGREEKVQPAIEHPKTNDAACAVRASNKNQDAVSAAEKNPTLAVVGAHTIAAEDVRQHVIFLYKVTSHGKKLVEDDKFTAWANATARRILPQLVESRLMEDYFRTNNIQPREENTVAVISRYGRQMKVAANSADDLARAFGELEKTFRRQFEFECKMNALYSSNTNLIVTALDLQRYYRNATNRLNRCVRINAEGKKKIDAAYVRLRRGEKWDDVATNVTEDALLEPSYADNWRDWISTNLKNVEPPELQAEISKLKQGEFTSPVETEEGCVVAQLVSREDEFVNLARILVRTAVPYEILNEETARQDIARDKKVKFQKSILTQLHKNVKIEYPLGRNFKYEIWPMSKTKNPTKTRTK